MNYLVTQGPRADPATSLTWGLIGLSIAVVLIIGVAVLWAVLARRDRSFPMNPGLAPVTPGASGMAWIYVGVPLTIVALFGALFWTMSALARVNAPPSAPALVIDVTGHQWWWEAHYGGVDTSQSFETANEIHIPTGQPVLIRLFGADVIHSFWVPSLTGKTDTIPGRTNLTWLQTDKAGIYFGQCTEYCGVQHAHMAVQVVAQTPADFELWRKNQLPPARTPSNTVQSGEDILTGHCGKCHTVRGTSAAGTAGPDLTHLMSRRTIAAGALGNTVDNLSGWISDPQSLKPGSKMPATYLSGPQLHGVVAYLETLQ